jgi:hypothetical protein
MFAGVLSNCEDNLPRRTLEVLEKALESLKERDLYLNRVEVRLDLIFSCSLNSVILGLIAVRCMIQTAIRYCVTGDGSYMDLTVTSNHT